ncbi:DUF4231 domain-containing protein [Actinoalloteichus hymeniacidonis]|uniref:DUF4231 family protein n=1 Tax=Actinoalloteichus hymeniacidonis TaxID=340345 RepID=A0AAC9HR58_9PSEU|nr:DUF4231 domain-containing protein [Actinoalloteichus hymeniacidonis]AOS63918.1 putative DUF4231 family protein [Actinoalloteichus hymeniacidonis]MBB5908026.1 hypothetical protein [Actinoalloteichus hymeniacidonis]
MRNGQLGDSGTEETIAVAQQAATARAPQSDPGPTPDLHELAEAHVLELRERYDWRAGWHRRFFRISGMLIIIGSASLPLFTTLDYANKEFVLSTLGVVIALLTGLQTFYRWDRSWATLRAAESSLTQLHWEWLLEQESATSLTGDAVEQQRRAATEALLAGVREVRARESEDYFAELRFPSARTR